MKKRNFETKIITGLLTAGMILSLTACGSSSNGSYGISDLMDADYAVASKEAAAPEASAYEDGFGMTEGYDSAGNAQDTSTTVPEETAATADRKLIKTVNMDVETREYDKLLSAVENKVTELGGYIESLDAYNGSTYYSYRSTRNANLTIRIPKDRLEEFQNTVSELGNVTSRSENVQDVTLTYVGCPADGTGETVAAAGTGGEHRRHHYHRTAPVRCEIPAGKYGIPVEKL